MLLHSLAFLAAARHTVLFHKPAGVVTTHADELGRPTVYDALRAALPAPLSALAWHACGRLDQNTSGLLVLTTDGGLVHHVTHPSATSCFGIIRTNASSKAPSLRETHSRSVFASAKLRRWQQLRRTSN